MDQRTEQRVQEWESRPFAGGFGTLRDLADAGFAGAVVTNARTWLFMLNGRAIGVFGGTVEDFDDAEGRILKAPHPSLPLLFAMREHGGDQQAKYYTNDTPISEAHDQLADAQFTGYIELSENVLSGDYYVLFYGGRSMSCAFIGNNDRLVTGDEAFQAADDEVGIYEVRSVEIDVVEIPEPTGEAGGATTGGADQADDEPAGGVDLSGVPENPAGDGPQGDTSAADPAGGDGAGAGGGDVAGTGADDAGGDAASANAGNGGHGAPASGAGGDGAAAAEPPAADTQPETVPDEPAGGAGGVSDAGDGGAGGTAAGAGAGATGAAGSAPADGTGSASTGGTGSASTGGGADAGGVSTATVSATPRSEFEDTRPIPSLDPDHTGTAEAGADGAADGVAGAGGPGAGSASAEGSATADAATGVAATEAAGGAGATAGTGQGSGGGVAGGSDAGGAATGGGADSATGGTSPGGAGASTTEAATGGAVRTSDEDAAESPAEAAMDAVADDAGEGELRQQLAVREDRIEELEAHLADLRVQRDGLKDDRDRLKGEVEGLQGRIAELESEVERLRSQLDGGTEGGQRLGAEEALQGTNLFVRYGTKSGGTLEKAHAGNVDKEEVNQNLRLEHHTQFDADSAVVDGEPFESFLQGSIYRGFVEWVVRELLYEIRDTGSQGRMADLYDALPRIDRAELLGQVSVEYTEDGQQYREQRGFDVVLRDRMGHPLLVADINDSRNPATDDMMSGVVKNASEVKESNDSLAGAMLVTASFFEPGALETADEASGGGGLMGGSSKASFVKLSRKRGYHLLLVETRGGEFHINVPEL